MKLSIFFTLLVLCASATSAFAQDPCPTAPADVPKFVDPNEKCIPDFLRHDLDQIFPVMPSKDQPETPKAETAQEQPVPPRIQDPGPPTDFLDFEEKKSL